MKVAPLAISRFLDSREQISNAKFFGLKMLYKINTEFQKYSTSESIKSLIDDLLSHKDDISLLDLSMNTYTPEVCKQICNIIKEMKNLKEIKLESIFDTLTYDEMCSSLESISECLPRTLVSFELPSNAVSCHFPEKFAKFLSECPLKVLNLHNCGLGEDGLKRISECLSKLENKDNLVSLNISKNRINVISGDFARVFSEFKNITEFRINCNTIEEKSMCDFLKGIANECLEILDLSDNFVCGQAIDQLGEVFLRNKISELLLQDIKIDRGDIYKLLKAMNKKHSQDLPGGIDHPKPELILDISCNDFEQDCIGLLEDLSTIFCIKKLVIFDNSYENIDRLREMITSDGGCIIDKEEDLSEPVDDEIMEKLKDL